MIKKLLVIYLYLCQVMRKFNIINYNSGSWDIEGAGAAHKVNSLKNLL